MDASVRGAENILEETMVILNSDGFVVTITDVPTKAAVNTSVDDEKLVLLIMQALYDENNPRGNGKGVPSYKNDAWAALEVMRPYLAQTKAAVNTLVLDPDMPVQEMRLHMGELSGTEILIARAAIRWANVHQTKAINTSVKDDGLFRNCAGTHWPSTITAESYEEDGKKYVRLINLLEQPAPKSEPNLKASNLHGVSTKARDIVQESIILMNDAALPDKPTKASDILLKKVEGPLWDTEIRLSQTEINNSAKVSGHIVDANEMVERVATAIGNNIPHLADYAWMDWPGQLKVAAKAAIAAMEGK